MADQTPRQDFIEAITPPQEVMSDGLTAKYKVIDREVLADLMINLGLFGHITTEADKDRHNVAVEILRDMGVLKLDRILRSGRGQLCPRNMQKIIEAMCRITLAE